MGTTLSQMPEDTHVQYIAGLIDDAGLDAVYADRAATGGEMMTAAYQATKQEHLSTSVDLHNR